MVVSSQTIHTYVQANNSYVDKKPFSSFAITASFNRIDACLYIYVS